MSNKTYTVAIAGATGAVGAELLVILQQRNFPVGKIILLASSNKPGRTIEYAGEQIDVEPLAEHDFADTDLALFSAGGSVSAEHAPRAATAGCIVIDNSSHFRREADIPLVVSEVNPEQLAARPPRGIIANPNCSTMQLLLALKPIYDKVGISRVIVSTYQAVSGSGNAAIKELETMTTGLLAGNPPEPVVFSDRIGFNVIPHIDSFEENGFTKEEMKIVWETHKILGDNNIAVAATAVRVPVFYGHSESVYIETKQRIDTLDLRELLAKAQGVVVIDERSAGGYPTPLTHAAGKDEVFVGRIRNDEDIDCGLHFWVVSDNTRKGAALNAVQLAELAIAKKLWRH